MSIEQQAKGKKGGEIRYLTPLNIDTNKTKKYCRFKKSGIKYIDYKDPDFLLKFVNEQGKLLPRRLTGTSLKYQRKVATAVKRASLHWRMDVWCCRWTLTHTASSRTDTSGPRYGFGKPTRIGSMPWRSPSTSSISPTAMTFPILTATVPSSSR